MAHYKRGKSRAQSSPHGSSRGHWLRHWPRWWDIHYHTRPHRTRTRRLERLILKGVIDADNAAWPLRRKPHIYYW